MTDAEAVEIREAMRVCVQRQLEEMPALLVFLLRGLAVMTVEAAIDELTRPRYIADKKAGLA